LSNIKLPKDTEIWAISNESSISGSSFKEGAGKTIKFPLLSDKNRKITNIFGLLDPRYIGSGKEGIPYASTYIINKKGVVLFAHIGLDYTKRPSVQKLLSILPK